MGARRSTRTSMSASRLSHEVPGSRATDSGETMPRTTTPAAHTGSASSRKRPSRCHRMPPGSAAIGAASSRFALTRTEASGKNQRW